MSDKPDDDRHAALQRRCRRRQGRRQGPEGMQPKTYTNGTHQPTGIPLPIYDRLQAARAWCAARLGMANACWANRGSAATWPRR